MFFPDHPLAGRPLPLGAARSWPSGRVARDWIMVLHTGDVRLAALQRALVELGYAASGAEPAGVQALLRQFGPPDVLIAAAHDPARGHDCDWPVTYARRCATGRPGLRVVYVCWLPWQMRAPLHGHETALSAPFTAAALASALAGGRAGASRTAH